MNRKKLIIVGAASILTIIVIIVVLVGNDDKAENKHKKGNATLSRLNVTEDVPCWHRIDPEATRRWMSDPCNFEDYGVEYLQTDVENDPLICGNLYHILHLRLPPTKVMFAGASEAEKYSLMFVDMNHSHLRPAIEHLIFYLQWYIVDIPGAGIMRGDVSDGYVKMGWSTPIPADEPHEYMLLLFLQDNLTRIEHTPTEHRMPWRLNSTNVCRLVAGFSYNQSDEHPPLRRR